MSSTAASLVAPAVADLRNRALAASNRASHTWAIVLAAGDGTRLRALTTDAYGVAVPKQFCSLRDGPSLLQNALRRAEALTARARVCVVVAEQHARWWRSTLAALPNPNIIVQPRNCGTAPGLLLPLLKILERDSQARVAVLPSDHHVEAEHVLTAELERALDQLRRPERGVVLLGMPPEDADPELGYVLPAPGGGAVAPVARFIEKPSAHDAEALIARGALWNSFIVAARGAALLKLLARHDADLVARMHSAVRRDTRPGTGESAISRVYRTLRRSDFSHDVLQPFAAELAVLRSAPCGWTDLGTPERVDRILRAPPSHVLDRTLFRLRGGYLSLERQYAAARERSAV